MDDLVCLLFCTFHIVDFHLRLDFQLHAGQACGKAGCFPVRTGCTLSALPVCSFGRTVSALFQLLSAQLCLPLEGKGAQLLFQQFVLINDEGISIPLIHIDLCFI